MDCLDEILVGYRGINDRIRCLLSRDSILIPNAVCSPKPEQ